MLHRDDLERLQSAHQLRLIDVVSLSLFDPPMKQVSIDPLPSQETEKADYACQEKPLQCRQNECPACWMRPRDQIARVSGQWWSSRSSVANPPGRCRLSTGLK